VEAGRGLDRDIALKLAPPVTSRSDVKALFGKPSAVTPLEPPNGGCTEEWKYLGAPNAATESLVVRFDRTGKLCSWSSAPSQTAVSSGD
jgi:hypothetical protein